MNRSDGFHASVLGSLASCFYLLLACRRIGVWPLSGSLSFPGAQESLAISAVVDTLSGRKRPLVVQTSSRRWLYKFFDVFVCVR